MELLFITAAILAAVGGLIWFKNAVVGDAGVKGVGEKKQKLSDAAIYIVAGAVLLIVAIVLYQQVNAALGLNDKAAYILNWADSLVAKIFSGDIPSLK